MVLENNIKGKMFENFVISEFKKKMINQGDLAKNMYFWRLEADEEYEVDLILDKGTYILAGEIKATDKLDLKDFDNLNKFKDRFDSKNFLIYTGPTTQTEFGTALNWQDCGKVLEI
jgi:predicted AAA+ superfamily ATPase